MITWIVVGVLYTIVFNFYFIYWHRVLTHQTVEFSKPLTDLAKTIDWLLTTTYGVKRLKRSVATHIKHHRTADTKADPHSPVHMRMSNFKHVSLDEADEILKDREFPELTKLDYFFIKYPYGMHITLSTMILIFGWVGIPVAVLMSWLPGQLLAFHAFAHHKLPGYVNHKFNGVDYARNVPYLFFFLGEEMHGNHHKWPNRANLAVHRNEIDLGYHFLRLLEKVNLVKITGETSPVDQNDLETVYAPMVKRNV